MTGGTGAGSATPAAAAAVGGTVLELVAEGRIAPRRLPLPEPGPGMATVRVGAVGLCGTDLHAFRGRDRAYPAVLCHDMAGRVEAVGEGVDPLLAGRRVTIDPTVACGRCARCAAGRPSWCAAAGYLGMTAPGVLAEAVAVPARQLVALPAAVSDAEASVLEPVAVALHLLDRVAPLLSPPAEAIVIGGGPMGVCVGQVLRARGWHVAVVEPSARRRGTAAALGLRAVAPGDVPTPGPDDPPALLVETSAAEPGVALVEAAAPPGSVVAVIGRAPRSPLPRTVLLKELAIVGVKGGAGRYPDAVELVRDGTVDVRALLTHHRPFSAAQRAFEETAGSTDVVRCVLEGPWGVA